MSEVIQIIRDNPVGAAIGAIILGNLAATAIWLVIGPFYVHQ